MRARQELVPAEPSPLRLLSPSSRPGEPVPPEEDASWLRDALRILMERRRVFLGVIGAAAIVLAAYATLMPERRVYEARAQMLVEPESTSPLDYGRPGANPDPEGSYYETQFRILRSRALARRTLATLAASAVPATTANTQQSQTSQSRPSQPEQSQAQTSQPQPTTASASPNQAAIDAVSSSAVDAFLRTLTISHIPNSRLVEVRVKAQDPEYAARAANVHAQAYIRQSVETALLASRQAATWLAGEIEDERARVEKGAAALDKLRQRDGALEERQTMVAQRLGELNQSVLRARAARVAKETAYHQVLEAQQTGKPPRDLAVLVPTPMVQQISVDLATQQRRDVELSATYGERHPERIKVREAIAFTENRLAAEVARAIDVMRSDVAAARQDEARLAAALEQQTAESSSITRKAVDYDALKREVANDRSQYDKLQQRARELRLSSDYELSNVRVIDPAEIPRAPLPDAKWQHVGVGAAGSLFLAFVLAFGLHYLDERVRSPEDIETHLGLPYLGMVPKVPIRALEKGSDTGLGVVKRIDLPLPFKEAMRDLRTHVLCTPAGRAAKILLVTSTNMDEGKTLVATNLATGLSQVGNRVLLIDLDLRQPSVHRAFDLPLQPGLSELLSGSTRARDPVRPTEVRGLWVLPAGRPLVNPGDLIGSSAFRQLIQSFSKTFDRIVIDSPPVMAVTDASLIAHEEVGVVFVVSADRTARRPAQAALDRLEAVGARFVGVVLNRVDLQRENSPYYMHYDDHYATAPAAYDDNAAPVPPPSPIDTATVSPPPSPSTAAASGTEPRA